MSDLLPQELIIDLLEETGGYGPLKATHLISSVKNFKPLKISQKSQSDINFALFEESFDRIVEVLQKDFRKTYVENGSFSRRTGVVQSLKKLKARDGAFAVKLVNTDVREPVFAYFSPALFYQILNFYLGGAGLKSEKTGQLTAIESAVLRHITTGLNECLMKGIEPAYPVKFLVEASDVSEEDQKEHFKGDYWCVEFALNHGGNKMPFTVCLPVSLLKFVKKQLDSLDETETFKPDPLWQKVVTDTVFASEVDLKINMGEFTIPFDKSLNINVGDVFSWEKFGPEVVVSFLDRPRLLATIGAVSENYAIRVEELLG